MFISLFIISCEQEEFESETNQIEFKNLDISPDLKSLSFEETYDFGANNRNSLDKLINEHIQYLFAKRSSKDETLLGFDIVISKKITKIKPITLESKFISAAGCPSGYESLGTCYSASCVKNKVEKFFNDHESDFENGANISFQLVNHMGGKRVCGRSAPAITQQ